MEEVRELLRKLARGESLTEDESYRVVKAFVENEATPAQTGAFIMATALKGTTADELLGAVRLFREKALKPGFDGSSFVDTAGTGGDGLHTVNVSTLAALVAAGAGAKVAKHGNRSVSSRSGSADLLEALGARVELMPEEAGRVAREVGFVFLFAPVYHPAMKSIAPARKEVGVRSLFNLVGPLVNPAGVKRQLIGVYAPELLELFAEVLTRLGVERAFVVHGEEGLDEVSPSGPTRVVKVEGGRVESFTFRPQELGLEPVELEKLRVSSSQESAERALALLEGRELPEKSAVLLNASFALVAAGLAGELKEAYEMARASLEEGKALKVLKAFVEATRS
ncbi:MAG: anthranilate phosphoribosyltransferase [Aquificae bacterium]|nr:anthranilate phosphoribosyltransferase [Aquificota bacterium]